MRKATYIAWVIWLTSGILLATFGVIDWASALMAIWFPIACALSIGMLIFITADIGNIMKERNEARTPNTCGNCLFGKTCDLINSTKPSNEEPEKCIGEKLGGATRGEVCSYYERVK